MEGTSKDQDEGVWVEGNNHGKGQDNVEIVVAPGLEVCICAERRQCQVSSRWLKNLWNSSHGGDYSIIVLYFGLARSVRLGF